MRRTLVFGGSGYVGAEVVRRIGGDVRYTWRTADPGLGRGYRVDLAEPGAVGALFDALDGWVPDTVVHAVGVPAVGGIAELDAATFERAMRVHVGSALEAVREVERRSALAVEAPAPPGGGTRSFIWFGALDRGQSFGLPAWYAAAQGALSAAAMALGHELGGRGYRVNVLALGLLDGGAARHVPRAQVEAYLRFAALRRVGTAAEAADAAVWLARGNTAINGKVVPINGGI